MHSTTQNETPSFSTPRSESTSTSNGRGRHRTLMRLFRSGPKRVAEEEGISVTVEQNAYRDAQFIPQSYAAIMRANDYRERLLDDARRYSPISSVFHLRKIPQTVVYRMLWYPITWVLVGAYIVLAVLTRLGLVDLGSPDDFDSGAFDGAEVLVTFSACRLHQSPHTAPVRMPDTR